MKSITTFINEASSKEEKELEKLGFIKYKDRHEVWYEFDNSKAAVQILQEEEGNDEWWNIRINHKYIENADGEPMSFNNPLEAAKECLEYMTGNNIK